MSVVTMSLVSRDEECIDVAGGEIASIVGFFLVIKDQ